MSLGRFVVLGLAHPRSTWSSELSRLATSAAVPIDYVRCVSADEVRARLAGGRPYSALLIEAGLPRLDRDLLDHARASSCAVVIIDRESSRDWLGLGAGAVLADGFEPVELMATLRAIARPIDRVDSPLDIVDAHPSRLPTWRGRFVAVTGPPGSGASTVAMALAQAKGDDPREHGLVLLADLALRADQAMMHDSPDVIPGVQELVDSHRHGRPDRDGLRRLVHAVDGRGYHLLLGLRRQRDWTTLRHRSLEAALDNLAASYRLVIADVDADVEGEPETGSHDIADRNLLARTSLARADAVLVVGTGGCKGTHALVRTLGDLIDFGLEPARLFPVVNRAPRSPRVRAAWARTLADLLQRPGQPSPASPLYVPERRGLDDLIRDGSRLPESLATPIAKATTAWLEAVSPRAPERDGPVAVPVAVGALSHWRPPDLAD